MAKKDLKLTPQEAAKYAEMIIEQISQGRSISATTISIGTYILLTGLQDPQRPDIIALGTTLLAIGYLYNSYRQYKAKKGIRTKLGGQGWR